MSIQNNVSLSEAAWRPGRRIGRQVWQWCSTKEVLLIFLIPVVVALVVSYLLPQAPAHLRSDEHGYEEWLSARQVQFKNWTPLLTAIGAFHVRSAYWFRVLLTILSFVLLVALGEQVRILLLPMTVQKPSSFYLSADAVSLTSPHSYEQTVGQVQRIFRRTQVRAGDQSDTYLYAGRHSWAKASTCVRYLGLLLLVSGLAIHARWGWRQSEIRVLPYEDVSLAPGGTLQLRLLNIEPVAQNGAAQYVPVANLQIAGQTTLSIQMGVPVRHRGYRYLWVTKGGPSVRLRAHRVSDPESPLTLYDYTVRPQSAQSLQFSFTSEQESDRQFILPDDQVVGWLRWSDGEASDGEKRPAFRIWVFGKDGQELGMETFVPIESIQDTTILQAVIADVVYRLEVAQYVVLDIAHQPARWVLWLGGALLAVGSLGLLIPQQQVWIQVATIGDQVEIKVREQRQGLLQNRVEKAGSVVARLGDTLDDNATHRKST